MIDKTVNIFLVIIMVIIVGYKGIDTMVNSLWFNIYGHTGIFTKMNSLLLISIVRILGRLKATDIARQKSKARDTEIKDERHRDQRRETHRSRTRDTDTGIKGET